MDASAEKKLVLVKKALKLARKGAPLGRTDMFDGGENSGGARKFQRETLHKLLQAGALRKVKESKGGSGTIYQLNNLDLVDKLLGDDIELADLVFDANRPVDVKVFAEMMERMATPPPAKEEAPTEVKAKPEEFLTPAPTAPPLPFTPPAIMQALKNGEAKPAPAPVQPAPTPAVDPSSIARTNELLTELVEVMHNAFQCMIYVRDKMDKNSEKVKEVETRLASLEKMLAPLAGDGGAT